MEPGECKSGHTRLDLPERAKQIQLDANRKPKRRRNSSGIQAERRLCDACCRSGGSHCRLLMRSILRVCLLPIRLASVAADNAPERLPSRIRRIGRLTCALTNGPPSGLAREAGSIRPKWVRFLGNQRRAGWAPCACLRGSITVLGGYEKRHETGAPVAPRRRYRPGNEKQRSRLAQVFIEPL